VRYSLLLVFCFIFSPPITSEVHFSILFHIVILHHMIAHEQLAEVWEQFCDVVGIAPSFVRVWKIDQSSNDVQEVIPEKIEWEPFISAFCRILRPVWQGEALTGSEEFLLEICWLFMQGNMVSLGRVSDLSYFLGVETESVLDTLWDLSSTRYDACACSK